VKTLACAFGLCIATVGAVGIVVPAILVWIVLRRNSGAVSARASGVIT